MKKFCLLLLVLISTEAHALFSDCDDEDYVRPSIEEVYSDFEQGDELDTEKILKQMCLKPQETLIPSKASWYAAHFQGRRTASAEVYDRALFTAAHRTLPFGSYVLVSNPANGKEIIVKVNDRGPFVSGRDLDLSEAAARELDIIRAGVAPIDYQVLELKK